VWLHDRKEEEDERGRKKNGIDGCESYVGNPGRKSNHNRSSLTLLAPDGRERMSGGGATLYFFCRRDAYIILNDDSKRMKD
jgi:hypothetical protein